MSEKNVVKVPILMKILEKRGMANQISKATGISTGNISDWKSGKSAPNLEAIAKIADYLDCSVDYLLGRPDNPQSHIRTTEVNNELLSLINQLSTEHQELVLAQIKGILSIKKNPPPKGNG